MGTPSDPDPFRNLYKANHERVRSLLARMVGPQDAEDLAQTVFAKAAKALPSFRGEAQGSTWLYRIAANVASDWLRSRAVHEDKLTVSRAVKVGECIMRSFDSFAVSSPAPSVRGAKLVAV